MLMSAGLSQQQQQQQQQSQQMHKPANTAYKSLQLADQLSAQANVAAQLSRRYEQLYRMQKYTDCIFHICDTQVKCHKLILSAASPVFEAMLFGALCKHDHDAIEIHDISPEIFEVLIEYIYIGSVNFDCLNLEETIELYYAAEKYLLNELATDCMLGATRKLRFANILPALELTVYMNLSRLFDVCVTFFMRCCVNNTQYMKYLKEHYVHVSKECVKAIIAACKEPHKLLFWYVYEWTQQECNELGLQQCESAQIIDELELDASQLTEARAVNTKQQQPMLLAERCYYKACRPFTVDVNTHIWRIRFKSERFISLMGIVLNGRLAPIYTNVWMHQQTPDEYNEILCLELSVVHHETAEEPQQSVQQAANADNIIWAHMIRNLVAKYNCDININWCEGIVLTPDVLYELQISWEPHAYGAEYPCSLQSCLVDGIKFIDGDNFSGSLVKGLRYQNLV